MPSTTEPSRTPRVVRPPIGWFRWWVGAAILTGLLAFIATASLYWDVPSRMVGILFVGWLIPFVILLSHLWPRPCN